MLLDQFFLVSDSPKILVEPNLITLNNSAKRMYQALLNSNDTINDISKIFPDAKLLDQAAAICTYMSEDVLGNHFSIKQERWQSAFLLSISVANEWQQYANYQAKLQEIFLTLSSVEDEYLIYKTVVDLAKKSLDIDRLGILLIDYETDEMVGRWGTDESGATVDESDFRRPLPAVTWVLEALAKKNYIPVQYDTDLRYENNIVGQGWNAMVALWDGDTPFGWIACDNFLKHQPLPDWKKEIIGELGRTVGYAISRLKSQQALKALNNSLELKIEEKTQVLQKTIQDLKSTQDELVSTEKLASLGTLVAGVAHEINTPLGVALTSLSIVDENIADIQQDMSAGKLTKSELTQQLNDCGESSKMALQALSRKNSLISSFKKLAANQQSEENNNFNLAELLDSVMLGLKVQADASNINLINEINADIELKGKVSTYIQIFMELISNAIKHAFHKRTDLRQIQIYGHVIGSSLRIMVADNGDAMAEEDVDKVFEPFFTRNREKGAGLGLSIVYNNVLNLGGKITAQINDPEGFLVSLSIPIVE